MKKLVLAVSTTAVLLLGAGCGEISVVDPTATGTADTSVVAEPGSVADPSAASVSQAQSTLGKLQVKRIPGKDASYERDKFGDSWSDAAKGVKFAGNGCDTRNDILRRDAKPGTVRTKSGTTGCKVTGGTWVSPYNGATYKSTKKIQIDHIIPLARAWASGAKKWPADRRLAFANDPDNLIAVDGSSNQSKSDKGPSAWRPAQPYQCVYAVRYVRAVSKYSLPITSTDKSALKSMLDGC
ncbi:HNH endonuclease family protein [Cryptosporangium arvum]|uniref:HNH endonuclease family protein n=1 Tax=Cryptosporangium arvum TaxID=80871 RepID=UPI0004AD3B3C|nr:HNH endonuclease family protein [Cryptosporangium arvum]